MPGLVPGIQPTTAPEPALRWIPATSAGMTWEARSDPLCAAQGGTRSRRQASAVKAGLSERRPVGIPCGEMGWGLVGADTSLSREGGKRRRSEDGLPFWRRDYAQTNRFELARRRRDAVRGRHRERTDGDPI